jgi:hypothetical protein
MFNKTQDNKIIHLIVLLKEQIFSNIVNFIVCIRHSNIESIV